MNLLQCSVMLRHIVLHYATLGYIMPKSVTLCDTVLHYATLFYIELHCVLVRECSIIVDNIMDSLICHVDNDGHCLCLSHCVPVL